MRFALCLTLVDLLLVGALGFLVPVRLRSVSAFGLGSARTGSAGGSGTGTTGSVSAPTGSSLLDAHTTVCSRCTVPWCVAHAGNCGLPPLIDDPRIALRVCCGHGPCGFGRKQ